MGKYEGIARILFLIDKKGFYYLWQIRSFIKQFHPELLDVLNSNRDEIVNYLCMRRGIYYV